MTEVEAVLRDPVERMDVLAIAEPQKRSWEELYKQFRHELGERLGTVASGRIGRPDA